MTLENLLRMEVEGKNSVTGEEVKFTPEFRVAVQKKTNEGVHFIIHANGHNSETLDFLVKSDELFQL